MLCICRNTINDTGSTTYTGFFNTGPKRVFFILSMQEITKLFLISRLNSTH